MRAPLCLVSCVLAVAATVLPPAQAGTVMREARWCIVRSAGLADVQWDCRYPTLNICAAAVGSRSDMCLENPNWNLPGYRRR